MTVLRRDQFSSTRYFHRNMETLPEMEGMGLDPNTAGFSYVDGLWILIHPLGYFYTDTWKGYDLAELEDELYEYYLDENDPERAP